VDLPLVRQEQRDRQLALLCVRLVAVLTEAE